MIKTQPKPIGGYMPNSPRYETKYKQQLKEMAEWASQDQIREFVSSVAKYASGWKWALAMRSNYHQKIVLDDSPETRIPEDKLDSLVKDDGILTADPEDCSHWIQEELMRDENNSNRRLMKCCSCNETFWIVKE